jgi:hypothetical protein
MQEAFHLMIGVLTTGFSQVAFERRQSLRESFSGVSALPFKFRFVMGQVKTLTGRNYPMLSGDGSLEVSRTFCCFLCC